MTTRLKMRLIVDGDIKQTLEADLFPSNRGIVRKIKGISRIQGEHHINPEAIEDVEMAYKTFESICKDYEGKKQTKQYIIEINYE